VHTEMRYRVRFGPRGVLLALILRRKLEQGLEKGLAGLKHHVETGELIGIDFCIPVADDT